MKRYKIKIQFLFLFFILISNVNLFSFAGTGTVCQQDTVLKQKSATKQPVYTTSRLITGKPVIDGKVGLEDSAWVAEMEVPLSQLRYSNKDEQVWGMHTWRWISRLQEESNWESNRRQVLACFIILGSSEV